MPHMLNEMMTYDCVLLRLVCQAGIAEGASGALQTVEMLLYPLDVLEAELGLDNLHVTDRIDVALYVDDLGIIESTHNLEDTVYGAYM